MPGLGQAAMKGQDFLFGRFNEKWAFEAEDNSDLAEEGSAQEARLCMLERAGKAKKLGSNRLNGTSNT